MLGEYVKNQPQGAQRMRNGKGVWNDVNTDPPVPVGVRQLQRLLEEHDPDGYDAAILSLERALVQRNPRPLPRTDLIIVVGTGSPTRDKMERLLPFDSAPPEYTAGNDLQLVEVVLKDGDALIDALYASLYNDAGGSNA
jgi:hypothetical protein